MRRDLYKPRKTANLKAEKNPWGSHDKTAFIPHDQSTPLRCPGCNQLFAPDWLDEPNCPTCGFDWRKKRVQRDMAVEAQTAKVNGGWNHAKLESLGKLKGPGQVDREGNARPLTDVAKNLTMFKVMAQRQAIYKQKLVNELRNQSPVSQALRRRPF